MKNLNAIKLILLMAVATFIFHSCKKDDAPTVIKPTKTGSAVIGELFANNLPQANKVTFKAEDGGFVNGSKTEIFIFANTLVDKNGNDITGDVDFEITEYLSKGDMATSGVTTISGDKMIESAGMFNLTASQNGEEVFIRRGFSFGATVKQDEFPVNQFQIFEGNAINDEDQNNVNWVPADSVPPLQPRQDSTGGATFNFNYFQFGYCNIDRFYNEFTGNEISSFKIKMPAGYDGDNSWALLLFQDYNSCAWTYWDKTDEAFKTRYVLGLGVKCKVLVVSVIDADKKEFEYEVIDVTLTDNTEVTVTNLQSITEAQIAAIVKAL